MTYQNITVDLADGLATVTLNRPQTLNAFTSGMKSDLLDIFTKLDSGEVKARALLLTGAGRGFCAGADLTEGGDTMADMGELLRDTYHPMLSKLAGLNMPIIAAVNGVAAGAGLSFALHADKIIAGESASFLMAFVRIGLGPDAGASYLLPRLIGEARARRMIMGGEQVKAATALEWGLAEQLVADEKLQETAAATARCMAAGPTLAYAAMRRLMASSRTLSYAEQLEREATEQGALGRTKDCAEGIGAFLEKRAANFTGE